MKDIKDILETKDELDNILGDDKPVDEPTKEAEKEILEKTKKAPAKQAVAKKEEPVEEKAIAMEDMHAHYEQRVRTNDRIMVIPYTRSYETVRGFAASVMFSGVTYSFKVGFSTPILAEHHDMVFDWLNESHRASGQKISANSEALAAAEAAQMAAKNQG